MIIFSAQLFVSRADIHGWRMQIPACFVCCCLLLLLPRLLLLMHFCIANFRQNQNSARNVPFGFEIFLVRCRCVPNEMRLFCRPLPRCMCLHCKYIRTLANAHTNTRCTYTTISLTPAHAPNVRTLCRWNTCSWPVSAALVTRINKHSTQCVVCVFACVRVYVRCV